MKRFPLSRLLMLAIIACILATMGCKKSGGGSSAGGNSYYVKFKVDGVLKTYSGLAAGTFNLVDGNGDNGCLVTGGKDLSVSDKNTMDILVSDPTAIAANITYTNYATTTAGQVKPKDAYINYLDESGVLFSAWPDDVSTPGVISDAKIVFTSVTSTSIKGNFSGTVYKEIDGSSPKHSITEGEFFIHKIN